MSHNYISDGPHNCILGGGNEGPGANNLFEYNTLDKCSYESSDTGAFYTCGQMANAFVNRGNELRHSLFKNIRNTEGSGVQGITIQVCALWSETAEQFRRVLLGQKWVVVIFWSLMVAQPMDRLCI